MTNASAQNISAPTDADITYVANLLLEARRVVQDVLGQELGATKADLQKIQTVLDRGAIEREATWALQSLGMALGKIFVENHDGYDWWMVEDEYGRDVCVRYRDTSLLFFPQTMISKRVEAGEKVDVASIYEWLVNELHNLRDEHYS